MKLEDIGFYTLSDERARTTGLFSPLQRCELIVTDKCNFKCPYCRLMNKEYRGELSPRIARDTVLHWCTRRLQNIRFSGGEPTTYANLPYLVRLAKIMGVKRIAISTNGSADIEVYHELLRCGVNDISISLDACCAANGKEMAGGIADAWEKVVNNIRALSKKCYVTVGIVITEHTVDETQEIIKFAHDLGVSDIRVVPSAQFNKQLGQLSELGEDILNQHPILKYRVNHFREGRNVRGLGKGGPHKCWLALDDMVSVAGKHFPCIIHFREGGEPIGDIGYTTLRDRVRWILKHDPHKDPICKKNCLDVCIDYNNKVEKLRDMYSITSLVGG